MLNNVFLHTILPVKHIMYSPNARLRTLHNVDLRKPKTVPRLQGLIKRPRHNGLAAMHEFCLAGLTADLAEGPTRIMRQRERSRKPQLAFR